jgi:hypothetical protein
MNLGNLSLVKEASHDSHMLQKYIDRKCQEQENPQAWEADQ